MTGSVDEGRAVGNTHLDFTKTSNPISLNILIEKLMKYGLDEQRRRCTENWLHGLAHRLVISGTKSCWRPVTRSVPYGSILCPILFNIFINDLDDGTEYTLSKFTDDAELGGVADTSEGHNANQRYLDKLEKWADKNLIKFDNGKCEVLHPWRKNPRHEYMLGAT